MTASGRARVLLIDCDAGLLSVLSEQLEHDGEFVTETAEDAADAMNAVATGIFDLALVDTGLADMDGPDLCREMRQHGFEAPIILLGADDGNPAADCGANDRIAKPFRIAALLSRVRAQLRHRYARSEAAMTIGPYDFHRGEKLLVERTGGRRIRLTEKEAALLTFLHDARDRTATRDTILDQVWGYNADLTTHTLETHIYRLRRKIESDPANAAILVTQPNGYRLIA